MQKEFPTRDDLLAWYLWYRVDTGTANDADDIKQAIKTSIPYHYMTGTSSYMKDIRTSNGDSHVQKNDK